MKMKGKLSLSLDELQVESFETASEAEERGTVVANEDMPQTRNCSGATCNEWTCPNYDTCQCGSVYNYPGSCYDTVCIW